MQCRAKVVDCQLELDLRAAVEQQIGDKGTRVTNTKEDHAG